MNVPLFDCMYFILLQEMTAEKILEETVESPETKLIILEGYPHHEKHVNDFNLNVSFFLFESQSTYRYSLE